MSRRLVRKLRNISSSPAEIKIKSATSNDSFGPSTKELNQVAIFTLNPKSNKEITGVIRKRIQDSSWRHVLKCLTVIEYVLLVGSLDFVNWLKEHKYLISTLEGYTVKNNEDVSKQIRHKSETILKLLNNNELLTEKRENFQVFRSQMTRPPVQTSGVRGSSLDINRNDQPRISTDNREYSRGTQSLELARNPRSSFDYHRTIDRLLADIKEE